MVFPEDKTMNPAQVVPFYRRKDEGLGLRKNCLGKKPGVFQSEVRIREACCCFQSSDLLVLSSRQQKQHCMKITTQYHL